MKVISLNTWGGEAGLPELLEFLRSNSDTDVFCLQEVWNGGEHMLEKKGGGSWLDKRVTTLLSDVGSVLPNYAGYFRPHFYDFYGLALFVKSDLEVLSEGEVLIYKEKGFVSEEDVGNHARILQHCTISTSDGVRTIVHLHGLWNGKGKGDSEDRLEQSERIIAFLDSLDHPFVLLGDFNLLPDTESLKKIESIGLRNLIAEHGVVSTRTSHYTKPEKFADYAFVSEGIEVRDFRVLPDEVSDHAPLLIDFSLT